MPAGGIKEQLQISHTAALMYIWIVMTVVSGVALIANLFLDEYDINIAHETEMGFKDKDKAKDTEMGSRR
jgi:L-alanine-DL-glutamate epimerase-like enolase superfamily enzyme